MPGNALIPLMYDGGASIQTPSLQSMAASSNALAQMQAQRQAMISQNALQQTLQDPDNFNPDGTPKPGVLQKVTGLNPKVGMAMSQNIAKIQSTKAETDLRTIEAKQKKYQVINEEVQEPAVTAYDEARQRGATPEQAQAEAQKVYSAQLASVKGSGLFSEDEIAAMPGNFDYIRVSSNAIRWKDFKHAQAVQDADKRAGEKLGLEREHLNFEERGGVDATKPRAQILTDPVTQVQFVYDLNTRKATTLDGKPYTPQGAQKMAAAPTAGKGPVSDDDPHVTETANLIAHYGMAPLSGYVLSTPYGQAVMAKVAKLNPEYRAEEYGGRSKAVKDFATGQRGNAVTSFNVAISHLNTLGRMVDALGNGDVKALNSVSQVIKEQFGGTAPTNFDAVKGIVGDEIIKAVIAGGGALADRENAQNQLDRAKTPEQLRGVIASYKELLGGQLRGLKKQYEDTTGLHNFDDRLAPETRSELGIDDQAKGAGGKAGGADYSHLWGGQ